MTENITTVEKIKSIETDMNETDMVEIGEKLPEMNGAEAWGEVIEVEDFGITSVIINKNPHNTNYTLEYKVTFQKDNIISFVIPKERVPLFDGLVKGDRLLDVQFYSPIAVFNGVAVICGKDEIKVGPKQGDMIMDVKIENN